MQEKSRGVAEDQIRSNPFLRMMQMRQMPASLLLLRPEVPDVLWVSELSGQEDLQRVSLKQRGVNECFLLSFGAQLHSIVMA